MQTEKECFVTGSQPSLTGITFTPVHGEKLQRNTAVGFGSGTISTWNCTTETRNLTGYCGERAKSVSRIFIHTMNLWTFSGKAIYERAKTNDYVVKSEQGWHGRNYKGI